MGLATMNQKYQIFISYRRDGGEDLARLMDYKLTERGFKVFFDVESLRSGAFNVALFEKIAECTDVLVVLPPHGLDRCTDPNDWVRLEIARAIELKKNVIPIMMRNFKFPDILSDDINSLRHMNGISASNEYFDATIEKLVSKLLNSKPLNSDDHLLKEAKEGNFLAMNAIGLRYEFGSESLTTNPKKAFAFYEQAAEADNLGAIYNLGDIYEQCEKDLLLVYDYGIENLISQKSAEDARKILHKLAVDCYTRIADKNFAPAICRLANFAEAENNFDEAIQLYQKAADLNYPPAQNSLGYYKMNGINSIMTKSDPKSAIDLYKKASDAGYAPAIYNYAHAMELQDIAIAIQMYQRIYHIIPQAAFSLAQLYEKSLNDLLGAIDYYRVAYESGIKEAKKFLKHCQDVLLNNKP